MKQVQELGYVLSKEEMVKLSEFQGLAIWRLHRDSLLSMYWYPAEILFIWALVIFIHIMFGSKISPVTQSEVILYWIDLFIAGSIFVIYRIKSGQNKREKWIEEAKKEMLLGMEEALVKHEIDRLTSEISQE